MSTDFVGELDEEQQPVLSEEAAGSDDAEAETE